VKETIRPLTEDQKKLVEENLGLAHHAASLYWDRFGGSSRLGWEQVLAAAYLGLIVAARYYDPDREFTREDGSTYTVAFSSFATRVVHHYIRKDQINHGYVIRVPDDIFRVDAEERERILHVVNVRSVSASRKGDSPTMVLADPRSEDPAKACDNVDQVNHIMQTLPDLHREVIRARYWEGLTLREIGQRHGFHLEWSRQLIVAGLKMLRTAIEDQEELCSTR